jgi:tRNA threonylcarbamoyladenosine biosynthesis protein TsaB
MSSILSTMYLTFKTDSPHAVISIVDRSGKIIQSVDWLAGRQLAESIHTKLDDLYQSTNINPKNLLGIIIFSGEGSFTGLRIGFSVANSIANSLNLPIVTTFGEFWIKDGLSKVASSNRTAYPVYSSAPHITVSLTK